MNTYAVGYRKIRENISTQNNHIYYFSIATQIGKYSYFIDSSMILDNVHPNRKGNEVIGKKLFSFF